ncbi:transposase [Liquorilactobacillus ghanensis]
MNRKIKALKRICYGLKNMDHFDCKIKKAPILRTF